VGEGVVTSAKRLCLASWTAGLFLAAPSAAFAYVGPGAGLTVIGAALAFVGTIILAVFGFIWYPMRRLLRRSAHRRKGERSAQGQLVN
jgi:hypothetical protein